MTLYVPSKGRAAMVVKNLPSWLATGLPVVLVVDDDEAEAYERAVHGSGATVLPTTGRGIGAARQTCLEHADLTSPHHFQCDDDHQAPDNAVDLMNHAPPRASFVSAWKRQLNLYLKPLYDRPATVVATQSNMTAGLRFLRHEPILTLGGFDTGMTLAEDCEVHMRVGWETGVRPYLHKNVLAKPVGARYQPGGCQSYPSGAAAAVVTLNERYGPGTASLTHRFTIHIAKFWKRVDERHGV